VEKQFESLLSTIGTLDFMGQVSLFLGTKFSWVHHSDGHVSVSLTQQSFIEQLMESLDITATSHSSFTTPYRSRQPVDSIPTDPMSSADHDTLRLQYQSLVGSLNWLADTTHPDIATIVSLLAQHQGNPSSGHLTSACYVVRYLAQTKRLGIYFTSTKRSILESFLHVPIQDNILAMSDAN